MKFRLFILACLAWGSLTTASQAQVRAKFVVDGLANCSQPYVRNFPIHFEGVGTLRRDRSASFTVNGTVESTTYEYKLGGRPIPTENGSTSLRVRSSKSLRAIREYPNNITIFDIRVVGNTCSMTVKHHLKPGKRQYTFTTRFGLSYCEKPVMTRATCSKL